MVCHPATRRERNEGEKSVPNKPYPVEISTEVTRKHGTQISPHKPILCRDLCGRGACFAVTVPMDHPSTRGHFPPHVDSVHEDIVPNGWGNLPDLATQGILHIHSPANDRCSRKRIVETRHCLTPALFWAYDDADTLMLST